MIKSALSPTFGWSKAHPPDYRVTLAAGDFKDAATLEPADTFVARIADKLTGGKDSDSRFVLLANITDFSKDDKTIRQFTRHLNEKVFDLLNQREGRFILPESPPGRLETLLENLGETIKCYNYRLRQKVGQKLAPLTTDVMDFLKQVFPAEKKPVVTLYRHHGREVVSDSLDYASGVAYGTQGLTSYAYGPIKNVHNGLPRIADVRQFSRDFRIPIEQLATKESAIKEIYGHTVISNYTVDLKADDFKEDKRPIVLIANSGDYKGGIAYGTAPMAKDDFFKDASRPVYEFTSFAN